MQSTICSYRYVMSSGLLALCIVPALILLFAVVDNKMLFIQAREKQTLLQNILRASRYNQTARALTLISANHNSYVAFCLSVKDEHANIREWILYHYMIGVEKFYVWDDNSSPPMAGVLEDLIQIGLVEYLYVFPSDKLEKKGITVQDEKYNTCLHRFGKRHTFMGFIDTDEFVILQQNESSLPALLQDLAGFGGVVLYYRSFRSSGHIMRPAAGVLASYTDCNHLSKTAGYVKTIARTDSCLATQYVHGCAYKPGTFNVDVWGNRYIGVSGAVDRTYGERAVLHHYITRSLEDWREKMDRGGGTHRGSRQSSMIWSNGGQLCLEGRRVAAELKNKLGDLLPPPPSK